MEIQPNKECCKQHLSTKRNKKKKIRMFMKMYMLLLSTLLTVRFSKNFKSVTSYAASITNISDEQLELDLKTIVTDTVKNISNTFVNKSIDFLSNIYQFRSSSE